MQKRQEIRMHFSYHLLQITQIQIADCPPRAQQHHRLRSKELPKSLEAFGPEGAAIAHKPSLKLD